MSNPATGPSSERDTLAAEIALGLSPEGAAQGDPRLEAEAQLWAQRFAGLADELEPVAPPAGAFRAIELAVIAPATPPRRPPVETPSRLWNRLGFWRAVSGLSVATACLAAFMAIYPGALPPQLRLATLPETTPPVVAATPEQPPAPPLGPRLVAAVGAGQGAPANFVATYDPRTQQILLVPAAALRDVPRGQVPELWLVPPDGGPPVLLGTIDPSRAHTVDVPDRFVPHAQSGAGLLVTLQARGAQPAAAGRTLARGRFSEL